MAYRDLRAFMAKLEKIGALKRVTPAVSPRLEITELCRRTLHHQGPALLFENPAGYSMPVLANLFGTTQRVALGMGVQDIGELRKFGHLLGTLQQPEVPQGLRQALGVGSLLKSLWDMAPRTSSAAACQEIVHEGQDVDLTQLPIQHCWPDDIAPLISWGLVITKGPRKKRQNLGVYRQQVLSRNQVIMRWLSLRGGALDFQEHRQQYPGQPFPVAVAIGADPATMLAAVIPIPDSLSEYQFAGLLRDQRTDITKALGSELQVPAFAEIILEGHIYPDAQHETGYQHALEGPFGDHTGYYNEQEWFPVLTIDRITTRRNPIYHSTFTGKPPDEPAILGLALNELFIPLLQKQFPEITDFYLPAEGCSYRMALVQIRKSYPGHARRIMFGIWGFLRQFMYTKFIVVVDEDIDIRSWPEVIWAITTRVDPMRDTLLVDHTPIDYLDFASPVSGLGSKMGLDATNKWTGETSRQWGQPITMPDAVKTRVDRIWQTLFS